MIESIFKPDPASVSSIEWTGNAREYDLNLYSLGDDHDEFLVINPYLKEKNVIHYIEEVPETDKCIVWFYNNDWVAKYFKKGWTPNKGYKNIQIVKSKLAWNKNPDIDRLMTFVDDPFGTFDPEPWDRNYKLVWYIDPRFNPLEDNVWAISCQPIGKEIKGIKEMGYLMPDITVEFNEHLPDLGINLDECYPPFWELVNECAYDLDSKHLTTDEPMYVVKFLPNWRKPKTWKWLGTVTPDLIIEYNPDLPDVNYDLDYIIPWHDFKFEHIWMLDRLHLKNNEDDIWAFKIKISNDVEGSKVVDYISPSFEVDYNEELGSLNYDLDYVIPWHDLNFEHVWLLDDIHLPNGEDDMWVFKIKACENPKGTKVVSKISPKPYINYNPDLPKLQYDMDYDVPWYDLKFEHIWLLDSKHLQNGEEDIYAYKIKYVRNPQGTKVMETPATPGWRIEHNPVLPKMNYNVSYVMPWYDLKFNNVFMLDKKHAVNAPEDIWAFKIITTQEPVGEKIVDSVSPVARKKLNADLRGYDFPDLQESVQYHDFEYSWIYMLDNDYSADFDIWAVEYSFVEKPKGVKSGGIIRPIETIQFNTDLQNLKININYKIPYHDKKYVHVWYLDPEFSKGEKIWAVKMSASKMASGEKEMGYVTPILSDLDVIFISYGETNCEDNWKRVIEKAPNAKRVKNIKGIFEAHKEAAKIANTDMFFVVDGDAYLVDDFQFDYQPGLFDRDCVYLWSSKNPVNNLVYGYGGVKLFPRKILLEADSWQLDMTTSIANKLKVLTKISNYTNFNTDEFSTWRSVFRECVKLYMSSLKDTENVEHSLRLKKWSRPDLSIQFADLIQDAYHRAVKFAEKNKDNLEKLQQINDRDWLKKEFEKSRKAKLSL